MLKVASHLKGLHRSSHKLDLDNVQSRGNVNASGAALPALTAEQNNAGTTPAKHLLQLPMLQPDQVSDSLNALDVTASC